VWKTHRAVITIGPRKPIWILELPSRHPKQTGCSSVWNGKLHNTTRSPQSWNWTACWSTTGPRDGCARSVVAIGPDAKNFAVGDKVFGFTWRPQHEKAHQEYLLAPVNLFVKIPEGFQEQRCCYHSEQVCDRVQRSVNDLRLELPRLKPDSFVPKDAEKPTLIWVRGSSVSQYAIQILSSLVIRRSSLLRIRSTVSTRGPWEQQA
jgi:hypothetical protein